MDWLNRLVEQFEHMSMDKAALLLLFVALLLLGGLMLLMRQRDKSVADVDKNQSASVMDLSLAIRSLAEGMPPIVEAFRGLLASMQQQEQRAQERFDAQRLAMATVGERRDVQITAIQAGVAAIPASVEGSMETLEERVKARLDEFEERLNEKIARLPKEVIDAFQAAMRQTKLDIVSEIKGDGHGSSIRSESVAAAGNGDSAGGGDPAGGAGIGAKNANGSADGGGSAPIV